MSLRIHKAGILTTLQDLGRTHYRHQGINPSGAMDTYTARLTNILAGNPERVGVLEFHFPAGTVLFEKDAWIVLGGADFHATLDDQKIDLWRLYFVKEGSTLAFQRWRSGRCVYMAIYGGFKVASWLDSKSTNLKAEAGGFHGRSLRDGDQIHFAKEPFSLKNPHFNSTHKNISFLWYPANVRLLTGAQTTVIRMIPGAEWEYLTQASQQQLINQTFTISTQNDRMGYRLESNPLSLQKPMECISSAVTMGTLQLLPNGQLILLMADAQTTGGYPRVGSIISVDLPILAQKITQESLQFQMVSLEEAEALFIQEEKKLRILSFAVHQKLQQVANI